ncbi:Alpha/beta hydrolase fold protein [Streptomyces venezuelae]|uniref:alpha/beta fold hydrolase n=1 Tax=Streptomyces gardneri TaxID=66892 RepID=UPI0006BD7364|nr:alpha/beta fold hydrolase [Streptomyces gardneri]ALO12431.1 Alpha/beta hydrolase fold protein [Streptomyces venezuelae]QPK49210.1 alpha/beta fold hydrolase [Streptomyces gardneri]WRK40719.1 alpha/beta fold hydrolase [Streptomyces venezuelae]CUM36951.1 2-hydroxy-6-oxo-6-phenylhexa-2,4-dienoate hydrolase [Streptomyces venezuelae]
MAFVHVNDVKLYYEESGASDATPLVLMHGGSGSLDDAEAGWSALIPAFAEHYRVLALEHRGHGRTDNPAGHLSYDLLAADLRAFVDTLELGPVHFAGVSDGGITGLRLALDYPDVLTSLVCVGVNFRVDESIRQALRQAEPETAERLFPEWAADLARRHDRHRGSGYWRELMRQIVSMASSSPDFSEADLARIGTPTLFIAGETDPFANTEQMIAFKRHVPGAEWLIVNNAWHTVQHSHAALVGPRILDFLHRQRLQG